MTGEIISRLDGITPLAAKRGAASGLRERARQVVKDWVSGENDWLNGWIDTELNELQDIIYSALATIRAEARDAQDKAVEQAVREYQEEVHEAYDGAIAEAKAGGESALDYMRRQRDLLALQVGQLEEKLAANRPSPTGREEG